MSTPMIAMTTSSSTNVRPAARTVAAWIGGIEASESPEKWKTELMMPNRRA